MKLVCLTETDFKRLMKIAKDNLENYISDYEYPGWKGKEKGLNDMNFLKKLKEEHKIEV